MIVGEGRDVVRECGPLLDSIYCMHVCTYVMVQ